MNSQAIGLRHNSFFLGLSFERADFSGPVVLSLPLSLAYPVTGVDHDDQKDHRQNNK